MNQILLLDVAPDPVSAGLSIAGLVLIGIVVFLLAGSAVTAFVFLFRRFMKTRAAGNRVVIGDACLNLDSSRSNRVSSQPISPVTQPENSPNQP
jgi:hypothetical protein